MSLSEEPPVGLIVAPLIGFVGDALRDDAYELFDGALLQRKPKVSVDETWDRKIGQGAIEEMREAGWGLVRQYLADPVVHAGPLEKESEEILKRALLAMWIAHPTGASIRHFLWYRVPWRDDSATAINSHDAWSIPHEEYAHHGFTNDDLELTRRILERIQTTYQRKLPIRRTLSLLYGAQQLWYWEARFATFTTVLESLFTTDNQEVSHKIAQRYAWFHNGNSGDRKLAYGRMLEIYKIRSKIVHGASIERLQKYESYQLLLDLELACQRSLQKVLLDSNVFSHFSGGKEAQEAYLTDLLFT